MKPLFSYCIIAMAAALSGCVHVAAVSTPPATRGGEHSINPFGDDQVRLARGTILAFDCVDSFDGGPCELADFSLSDSSVVEVKTAHLERAKSPYGGYDARPRTAFVLVGKKAGTSDLTIQSSIGEKTLLITVE